MEYYSERLSLIRPQLLKAITAVFDYPLTYIFAPVGYEKGFELRAYLKFRGSRIIRYSVPEDCGKQGLAFDHFLHEVLSRQPGDVTRFESLSYPFKGEQILTFIDLLRMISDSDGAERVFIIERAERIHDVKALKRILRQLAEADLNRIHIVLLANKQFNFDHADLIESGLLYRIDQSIFAYSEAEIAELMRLKGLERDDRDVRTVYDLTLGWPVAVRMLIASHREGDPFAETHSIESFIRSNVFDILTEAERDILVKLSIFDTFSTALAASVFPEPGQLPIIQALTNENPFIMDEAGGFTFRIHPLVRSFLQRRLLEQPIEMNTVYERAAEWFLTLRDCDMAVRFYIKAGKLDTYLSWANEQDYKVVYLLPETLMLLYEAIPKEAYTCYPIAVLSLAGHFVNSEVRSGRPYAEEIVEAMSRLFPENDDPSDEFRAIYAMIELVRLWLSYNKFPVMIEHVERMLHFAASEDSCLFCNKVSANFGTPLIGYSFFYEPGTYNKTMDFMREALTTRSCDTCRAAVNTLLEAEDALEKGLVEEAKTLAVTAFNAAVVSLQFSVAVSSMFISIRIKVFEGKFAEVTTLLKDMRRLLTETRWRIGTKNRKSFERLVDFCEGYAFAFMNESDRLRPWLKDRFSLTFLPFGATGYLSVIRGRVLISGPLDKDSKTLLESLGSELSYFKPQLGLLHHRIQLAVVQQKLYGDKAGARTLQPVILEAQKDDLIFIFAEYAGFLLPMLSAVRADYPSDTSFLDRIERLCRSAVNSSPAASIRTAIISQRERDVLKLLEQGLSRKAISESLLISPSTVKRHIESLFRKCGASKASQAVRFAREHKLL